uniref:Stc1 domain-containing protein n=1 Tax=Peronospora matthiolae TaxID=2874970 RepID=A0AAV1UNN1_9STRA
MSTGRSSTSARCAFCGANVSNASARILVAFAAPSENHQETSCAAIKPLKWRFLSNKGPCTKLMCLACAQKRKVNLKADYQHHQVPVTVESWDPEGARNIDRLPKALPRDEVKTATGHKAMKVEIREPWHQPQHRHHCVLQSTPVQLHRHEKHDQALRRERIHSQQNMCEQSTINGRRRRATHVSDFQLEGSRQGSALQSFANDRAARKSMTQTWPSSPVEVRSHPSDTHRRTSVESVTSRPRKSMTQPWLSSPVPERNLASVTQRRASVESATPRLRKSSSGPSGPLKADKKGRRLNSTADILGMSQSLDLPPNYFEMSSSSPKVYADKLTDKDPLDWVRVDLDDPQMELPKQREGDEERHRRQSASYAHMLLRMRLHYNTVQANGRHARPASAPPRRIRSERVQSVAVRHVRSDTITRASANFAIDLGYLHAYKDAR